MKELLNGARKGNKYAFEEIVNRIYKKLYIIAKAKLMDEQEAQEVVWDSLLTAHNKLWVLRDINKFNSWITKIVINNCNSVIRKRKIQQVSFVCEKLDNNGTSESEYVDIEDNIDFFDLLSELNDDERTIIAMYYSEEYTTKEISETLKINENTIRSKIKRAKQKIKNKYDRSSCNER